MTGRVLGCRLSGHLDAGRVIEPIVVDRRRKPGLYYARSRPRANRKDRELSGDGATVSWRMVALHGWRDGKDDARVRNARRWRRPRGNVVPNAGIAGGEA